MFFGWWFLDISFLWRDSASLGHFRMFLYDIYMLYSVFYVVCDYEGYSLTFTSTLKRKCMGCVLDNILYLSTPIKSNCVRRSGFRILAGQRFFSLLQKSSLLFNVYRNSFSWVKRLRSNAVCSLPSIAKVKNEWSYTYMPPTCLHGGKSDNFAFNLFISIKFLP